MDGISLPEPVAAAVLRYGVRPVLGPRVPVPVQRFWTALMSGLSRPPLGVRRERRFLGPVETATYVPRGGVADDAPVVLYLHGGAFVAGSWRTHGGLAGYLARDVAGTVHLLDYARAPEHPYPAGREDARRAYRFLVGSGVDPGRIVVAGDSAGGTMVADLLLDLAAEGAGMPAAGVMMSPAPGLDRRREGGRRDTLVRAPWLAVAIGLYRRPPADRVLGADPEHLAAWPPVLIQFSEDEILAPECRELVAELHAAGASPQVVIDPGGFHVLALLPGLMSRGRTSVRTVAEFVHESVHPARTEGA